MGDLKRSLDEGLTLGGCILFTASILLPFMTITYFTIIPELNFRLTYWSFQAAIIRDGLSIPQSENVYFDDFWFEEGKAYSYPAPSDLRISSVFVLMFLAQVATLYFGVVSFFGSGKGQLLPSFVSSASVLFLMVYVIGQASSQTPSRPVYELGFWLTMSSAIIFLAAYALPSIIKKRD